MWVSMEPLSEEVVELAQCYPEVAELPKKEVRGEMEEWLAKRLVARTLDRRVLVEVVACEFQRRVRLKGDIAAFNLE